MGHAHNHATAGDIAAALQSSGKVSPDLKKRVATAARQYQRNGVAIIPKVFTKQEADNIRAAALMTLTSLEGKTPYSQRHKELEVREHAGQEYPLLLFWPLYRSQFLDRVRTDKRYQYIVRSFLGDDVKQLNNQVYFRMPGDGDSFHWHQDVVFRRPYEDYPGIEESYLQTIVVVDEITPDNGAVQYVHGSHKLDNLELTDPEFKNLREFDTSVVKKLFPNKEPKMALAKPGDVVVWSVMSVHGSKPNNSPHMRMTYMNGFAKADAAKDWPLYLKDGKLQEIDARLIP